MFLREILLKHPHCHTTTLSLLRYYTTPASAVQVRGRHKRLLILGCGWGSYSVLQNVDREKYDVTVISNRNHFLFTPLLASTTVGTLEFRSIIEPIRNYGFRDSDYFHLAEATELHPEKKTVSVRSMIDEKVCYDLWYDKLVIGVGCRSSTFGVPGVRENAFFLKEIFDAQKIRRRIMNNIELAADPGISDEEAHRLLHVVIVGGGPTGVEFGAELYDFVTQDMTRLYKQRKERVYVSLVESNQILAAFDSRLRNYARKKMMKRSGFTLKQSSVVEVKSDSVVLNDGEVLPCGLVVWAAGIAPRPFIHNLALNKNKNGQLLTDKRLLVKGDVTQSIFALGDCADIDQLPLPCTAQVAERQGRYLAKTILNNSDDVDLNELAEFQFRSMGMLAYVGGYTAVTDTPDIKLSGFHSWLLWRSAYLTRLGSWRLRMQVPMDWLKTLVFGRDVSNF